MRLRLAPRCPTCPSRSPRLLLLLESLTSKVSKATSLLLEPLTSILSLATSATPFARGLASGGGQFWQASRAKASQSATGHAADALVLKDLPDRPMRRMAFPSNFGKGPE